MGLAAYMVSPSTLLSTIAKLALDDAAVAPVFSVSGDFFPRILLRTAVSCELARAAVAIIEVSSVLLACTVAGNMGSSDCPLASALGP